MEASQPTSYASTTGLEQALKYAGAVCQIDTKYSGTGFLVAQGIILTCNHVLPTKEVAETARVRFSGPRGPIALRLNPHIDRGGFFITTPDSTDDNGDKVFGPENLDFTLVEIEKLSEISEISREIFDLERSVTPQFSYTAHIIQHPVSSQNPKTAEVTILNGNQRIASTEKELFPIDNYVVHHHVETAGGSSGSPLINDMGELYAVHQGICNNPEHNNCKIAVRTDAIVRYLNDHGITLDNHTEKNLTERLKELYTSLSIHTLTEEKKTPINNIFTKLSIVEEHERKDRKKVEKTNQKEQKQGIELENLFDMGKLKDEPQKRILFTGSQGIGKSTLCQHIAYQWAQHNLWPQFKALFLIRLRDLSEEGGYTADKKYSAFDILGKECGFDSQLYRSVFNSETWRNETLLIFDGYDELPNEVTRYRNLNEAFEKLKNLFPNILITSRPQRVLLKTSCKVEIHGYDPTSIDRYISRFFHQGDLNDEGNVSLTIREVNLRNYLKKAPQIFSLAHNPLHLEILCSYFKNNDNEIERESLTITSLYNHIVEWLCKRVLLRSRECKIPKEDILEEYNPESIENIQPIYEALMNIAWNMTENNKYTLEKKEITKLFRQFRLHVPENKQFGFFQIDANSNGSFSHSTFQDYFSALYLARQYIDKKSDESKKIVEEKKLIPRYGTVFWMAAGYLSEMDDTKLKNFFDDLFSPPHDLAKTYELLLLIHSLNECNNLKEIPLQEDFITYLATHLKKIVLKTSKPLSVSFLKNNPRLLFHKKITDSIIECLTHTNRSTLILQTLAELARLGDTLPDSINEKLLSIISDPERDFNQTQYALYVFEHSILSEKPGSNEILTRLINAGRNPGINQNAKVMIFHLLKSLVEKGKKIPNDTFKQLLNFQPKETGRDLQAALFFVLEKLFKLPSQDIALLREQIVENLSSELNDQNALHHVCALLHLLQSLSTPLVWKEFLRGLVGNPKTCDSFNMCRTGILNDTKPQIENQRRPEMPRMIPPPVASQSHRESSNEDGTALNSGIEKLYQECANPDSSQGEKEFAFKDFERALNRASSLEGCNILDLEKILSDSHLPKSSKIYALCAIGLIMREPTFFRFLHGKVEIKELLSSPLIGLCIDVFVDSETDETLRQRIIEFLDNIITYGLTIPEKQIQTLASAISDGSRDDIREGTVYILSLLESYGPYTLSSNEITVIADFLSNENASEETVGWALYALLLRSEFQFPLSARVIEILVKRLATPSESPIYMNFMDVLLHNYILNFGSRPKYYVALLVRLCSLFGRPIFFHHNKLYAINEVGEKTSLVSLNQEEFEEVKRNLSSSDIYPMTWK